MARKVRADKKKEIKANLTDFMRDVLTERAVRAQLSPMVYTSRLAVHALTQEAVIESFARYLKRAFFLSRFRLMIGNLDGPGLVSLLPTAPVTRFPVKLLRPDYERIAELAYALDCSLTQAVTLILKAAVLQGLELPTGGRKHA